MNSTPYNEEILNVGNSIFPGFNDKEGIMICGYEYGQPTTNNQHNQEEEKRIKEAAAKINTFFNKTSIYKSPYDLRICKWFEIFGHPLGKDEGKSNFDKTILQTNWCDSQDNKVSDYSKFLAKENIENFITHVKAYEPRIIFFMGSKLITYLQDENVIEEFRKIFGDETATPITPNKEYNGKKFKVSFQDFEKTRIISLPHPSGSIGLTNEYIGLFAKEIEGILTEYKFKKFG
jgi:hypothetical protein